MSNTSHTTVLDDTEETQTWDIVYNESDYPQIMNWTREETKEENIVITYYEMTD